MLTFCVVIGTKDAHWPARVDLCADRVTGTRFGEHFLFKEDTMKKRQRRWAFRADLVVL